MYFLIFLAAWLTLPILGFWPIVSESGSWANNSLSIDTKEKSKTTDLEFLTAYAEEISEWYIKAAISGALVVPFAIFVAGMNPLLSVAAFLLMQIASLVFSIPKVYRMVEYVGKAANVAVLPRDTKGSGAARLQRYYPQFAGMSQEEIQNGIDRAAPVGKFLVKLLGRNIKRHTK